MFGRSNNVPQIVKARETRNEWDRAGKRASMTTSNKAEMERSVIPGSDGKGATESHVDRRHARLCFECEVGRRFISHKALLWNGYSHKKHKRLFLDLCLLCFFVANDFGWHRLCGFEAKPSAHCFQNFSCSKLNLTSVFHRDRAFRSDRQSV